MSTDRLEEFIKQNRKSFDQEIPDPAIWDRVTKRKAPAGRIPLRRIAWQAAAVVVIFISSYYFHDFMDNRMKPAAGTAAEFSETGDLLARELLEAEVFYSSQIKMKKEEVFRLAHDQPAVLTEVDMELVELDRVYDELKKDLNDNLQNTEVIEAMIQNYRLKLQILEEMLLMLNQNDQNHEDKPVHL